VAQKQEGTALGTERNTFADSGGSAGLKHPGNYGCG